MTRGRPHASAHTTRRTAVLAAALLPFAVGAHDLTTAASDAAADRAQLAAQAAAWDAAIVRKDRAAIEANMADDFRQIDGDADIEHKAGFVDGLVDPKLTIDPYGVDEFEIRLYGDVALLSGRTRMTGRYADKPWTTHYRYIDVYARRGGQWKIVSVQITRLAKP